MEEEVEEEKEEDEMVVEVEDDEEVVKVEEEVRLIFYTQYFWNYIQNSLHIHSCYS